MDSLLASVLLLFLNTSFTAAQQLTCISNLPPFINQGTQNPLLPVGIQALLLSYRFTCNARILRWGVAIHGTGEHSIRLQVWRPVLDGENRLFQLVGSNYFHIKPSPGEKLIHLVPGERWQVSVESGDVIGFYLEDNPSITDDFKLQHHENVTGVMLYAHAKDPFTSMDSNTLPIRLYNTAPTIRVLLDSEDTQTSNRSPEATSQATPTEMLTTPLGSTTVPASTPQGMRGATLATTNPIPSTANPTTAHPTTSHPTTAHPTTTHSTLPSTSSHPTSPSTPPTTRQGGGNIHLFIGCLVVGGVCVAVLLVTIVLGVWLRKRQRQRKGTMHSTTSEQGGGDSTWNLSETLLTENHAYDHTHTGLIASWDWLPKQAKAKKFRIWRAHDYELPVKTCPTPNKSAHKLERSLHIYECPASFLQSVHHYQEIPVPVTLIATPTTATPTNSPCMPKT